MLTRSHPVITLGKSGDALEDARVMGWPLAVPREEPPPAQPASKRRRKKS